jgi:surface polysaccharide O-acyltransferase-like enzyme
VPGTGTLVAADGLVKLPLAFVTGPVAYHLWFVYVLLGIYLVVPLLRPITAQPDGGRRLLRYALLLWLVFTVGLPFLHLLWHDAPVWSHMVFPGFPTGYLGIFLLGYFLHTFPPAIRVRTLVVMMVAGFLAIFGAAYVARGSGTPLWSYDNMMPPVILYSCAVFLLVGRLFIVPRAGYPLVALISRLSFRIYLIHALILAAFRLNPQVDAWYLGNPLVSLPAFTIVAFVGAAMCAWAIEQLAPIRRYV